MKSFKLHLIIIILVLGLSSCEKKTYTLSSSVSPSLSGSVTPSQGSYEEGEVVTLVAQPNNGWIFQKWEGDISGTTNSASLTMNSNKNIVAVFLRRDYPLTITIGGEGTIQEKVISTPSKSYPFETIVELTPVPKAGWMFYGWEGDLSGIDYPKRITIDKERTVKVTFIKTLQLFGGSNIDLGNDICSTKDGGYIIVGSSDSNDGIFTGVKGYQYADISIVKIGKNGEPQWVKKFGGNNSDSASKIIQTEDEGFIITGHTNSSDGDFVGLIRGPILDFIMKLNSEGEKLWISAIGDYNYVSSASVVELNNEYYVLGTIASSEIFNIPTKGRSDIIIHKFTSTGQRVWSKTYGGSKSDASDYIIKAHDDGFIVFGASASSDYDFSQVEANDNSFLMKIDINGNIQWLKTKDLASGSTIEGVATKDGGYISVGHIRINNLTDILVRKYSSQGALIWEKQFGGSESDEGFSIIETKEGDIIIVGNTRSNDGDFFNKNNGGQDAFAMKLNNKGEKLWVKTFGGSGNEHTRSIYQINDEKILIVGSTSSKEYAENAGVSDIFVIDLRYFI